MKKLLFYLTHGNLILALMILTLLIVDRFNQSMAFIDNRLTKGILFVFAALVIVQAGLLLYQQQQDK